MPDSPPIPIAILMATYNGSAHLCAQVQSLQAQTRRDWRLYACDDGSTDDTPALLAKLAAEDERIVVLHDAVRNRGSTGRFGWLLEQTRTQHEIFFFCDQDDVWLPRKVERMARVLEDVGVQTPALVHCDLAVVDKDLRVLRSSLFAHLGINPRRHRVDELIAHNTVTGCACAFTAALAALALPLPEFPLIQIRDFKYKVLHDGWLALIASHCGRLITLPEALVLYRQHERNAIGAGTGRRAYWHRAAPSFIADRFSVATSRYRKAVNLELLLPHLEIMQARFGGLERPITLLARGRRRDLLAFIGRYRLGRQSPLKSLFLSYDILRAGPKQPVQPR